jgi:cytochrome c biogenesis protein CcmG/thiol:disulfide interchange protein DsbE
MAERAERTAPPRGIARRVIVAVVPLVVAVALGAVLWEGLYLNPREIPSALIGKPAPAFTLPALPGREPGLSSDNLKGEVSLVNVFASWCVACRVEHPLLLRLKQEQAVPIHGIDYKDDPQAALGWLAEHGDPYTRVGADRSGRVGIDWGVYGVPETFVIDRDGVIVCKQIGPITEREWTRKLKPAIEAARRGERPTC